MQFTISKLLILIFFAAVIIAVWAQNSLIGFGLGFAVFLFLLIRLLSRSNERYVEVMELSEIEAHMRCNYLAEAGIKAKVENRGLSVYGTLFGSRLLVQEDRLEEARALLRELATTDDAKPQAPLN